MESLDRAIRRQRLVSPGSCLHYNDGGYSPDCSACLARDARSARLQARHYPPVFADELDEANSLYGPLSAA